MLKVSSGYLVESFVPPVLDIPGASLLPPMVGNTYKREDTPTILPIAIIITESGALQLHPSFTKGNI